MNAKTGDKLIISKTDATIRDYSNLSEQQKDGDNEEKKLQDSESAENNEKTVDNGKKSAASPCVWKFYSEKSNQEHYNIGYRIMLTYQKVIVVINCSYSIDSIRFDSI
jgi:hypothetical protein